MTSGPWSISKAYVDGCSLYVIWKDGSQGPLAFKNDFEEAKEFVDATENRRALDTVGTYRKSNAARRQAAED
jgi:hypothetical protein